MASDKRATITLSEEALESLTKEAEALNLTVPQYIRRSLALTRMLSRYMDGDTLTIVPPASDDQQAGSVQVAVLA